MEVEFVDVVTSSKTILTPEPASKIAQIIPGTMYIDLIKLWDFVAGVSFIVDMISIKREEYAMIPYTKNSMTLISNTLFIKFYFKK